MWSFLCVCIDITGVNLVSVIFDLCCFALTFCGFFYTWLHMVHNGYLVVIVRVPLFALFQVERWLCTLWTLATVTSQMAVSCLSCPPLSDSCQHLPLTAAWVRSVQFSSFLKKKTHYAFTLKILVFGFKQMWDLFIFWRLLAPSNPILACHLNWTFLNVWKPAKLYRHGVS